MSLAEAKQLSVYATAGIGGTTVGLAARAVLTVAHGHWFVGATASATDELSMFGPSPSRQQQDLGLLGGMHSRGRFYVAGVGAGLAHVHSVDRGAFLHIADKSSADVYEKLERRHLGIPVVAHASLYWGPIGIGVMTFANLNATLATVGAAGTLNLGMF